MHLGTYIIFLCLFILVFTFSLLYEAELSAIFSGSIGLIYFLFGFILPIGIDDVTYYKAVSTRMGDEIVVQGDFSTLVSSNMKYIDKPVKVAKIDKNTVWGYAIETDYRILLEEETIKH